MSKLCTAFFFVFRFVFFLHLFSENGIEDIFLKVEIHQFPRITFSLCFFFSFLFFCCFLLFSVVLKMFSSPNVFRRGCHTTSTLADYLPHWWTSSKASPPTKVCWMLDWRPYNFLGGHTFARRAVDCWPPPVDPLWSFA